MPLTPAIRPVSAISMTAATPISPPPMREATGVKGVAVILSCSVSIELRPTDHVMVGEEVALGREEYA